MNKRMRDLLDQINNKKNEAKNLLAEKKLDEAKALTDELKNLQKEFDVEASLYEEEKNNDIEDKAVDVDAVKAFYKALRGDSLTEAENALLTGGANGEDLIIPEDVQTTIKELRRQYKSARDLINYYPTTTLSGSFVYEDSSTATELTNFTDGDDIPNSNEPKFNNISYSIKDYGALLPVSNKLLQNESGGLLTYLGRWFNRKAIRTENKKVFDILKSNKNVKSLADWKELKSSINKDLDPALLVGMVIVTNQDGFDVLDSAVDSTGRPILQPDPTNPTKKMLMGYSIEVFANSELPSIDTSGTPDGVADVAPIFYGNLKDGATFIDRDIYRFDASEHAAFNKNQTVIRIIEEFDTIQADKDAYVYGHLSLYPVV